MGARIKTVTYRCRKRGISDRILEYIINGNDFTNDIACDVYGVGHVCRQNHTFRRVACCLASLRRLGLVTSHIVINVTNDRDETMWSHCGPMSRSELDDTHVTWTLTLIGYTFSSEFGIHLPQRYMIMKSEVNDRLWSFDPAGLLIERVSDPTHILSVAQQRCWDHYEMYKCSENSTGTM